MILEPFFSGFLPWCNLRSTLQTVGATKLSGAVFLFLLLPLPETNRYIALENGQLTQFFIEKSP